MYPPSPTPPPPGQPYPPQYPGMPPQKPPKKIGPGRVIAIVAAALVGMTFLGALIDSNDKKTDKAAPAVTSTPAAAPTTNRPTTTTPEPDYAGDLRKLRAAMNSPATHPGETFSVSGLVYSSVYWSEHGELSAWLLPISAPDGAKYSIGPEVVLRGGDTGLLGKDDQFVGVVMIVPGSPQGGSSKKNLAVVEVVSVLHSAPSD